MRLKIDNIDEQRAKARLRPDGMMARIFAVGRAIPEGVEIDSAQYEAIVGAKATRAPIDRSRKPPEITAAELATNFAGAMERWAGSGFKTVTQEQYDIRAGICESCEYWDGAARLGLGKCKAPGCGCTRFKRWLATEKCPLGKWPL